MIRILIESVKCNSRELIENLFSVLFSRILFTPTSQKEVKQITAKKCMTMKPSANNKCEPAMLPKESPRSKAHKIVEPKKKSTRHVKSRSLGEPFTEEEEAELSYHMLENDDPFHYLAT